MSDHHASIDGSLLRLQRETRGWTTTDLAVRSCLSIKQIRQLEEGGSESFYSEAVKLTAAKKVASLLGLSIEQVLGQPPRALPSNPAALLQATTQAVDPHSAPEVAVHEASSAAEVASKVESAQAETTHVPSSPVSKSSHLSWWVIAILFAAALLVAAWLNPSAEPVVTEAAPPVQTLPADLAEGASAAAGVASDAAEAASH